MTCSAGPPPATVGSHTGTDSSLYAVAVRRAEWAHRLACVSTLVR